MSSSRLEKVRSSIFRSKPDSPSPRRSSRPFSRILASSPKLKPLDGEEPPPDTDQALEAEHDYHPLHVPRESHSTTRLPLNPQSSPASTYEPVLDNRSPTRDLTSPLPMRELQYGVSIGEEGMATEVHNRHEIYSDTSELDERYMKRKLMDMESSFLPSHHESLGWRSPPQHPDSQPASAFEERGAQQESGAESTFLDSESSGYQQTLRSPPAQTRPMTIRHTYRISEEKPEDLEEEPPQPRAHHSLSSPSAAAAQRSRLRAAAGFNPLRNATTLALTPSKEISSLESQGHRDDVERPSSAPHEQLSLSESKPDERAASEEDRQEVGDEEDTRDKFDLPEEHEQSHEQPRMSTVKRPSYLKSRQASQRSSASSFLSNDAGSDLAFTGSGGGTPGSLSTVRPGYELSRLPSLGSVASTMSANTEPSASQRKRKHASGLPVAAQETNLTPVAEHKSRTQTPIETPAGRSTSPLEPRDTVLARNVRNVEVPATVARNYREAQSLGSGNEPLGSLRFSRTKGELSLKEQNGRIDKLSKENFDLKLKIHYLYQALQDRSDEGVKDLISKNAQLSTDIIKVKKDNQALRKRVKVLEREAKARDDGLSAVRTVSESEDLASSQSWQQAQLEDEIAYLRDRMQAIEEDNERLRQSDVAREFEKRRVADHVKSMAGGDHSALLKDELEQERTRRERADREAQQLRMELSKLRTERSPMRAPSQRPNGYHQDAQGRPPSKLSATSHDVASLSGTTMVEQLKQENTELRRDLGAQTSMLTSRNRERERLQQEIEDLKLMQRRGEGLQSGPVSTSGDSILDRSVSRNNLRPPSRAGSQRTDALSEGEKEQYEAKHASLRDENAVLRMRIQDLQSELDMLTGSAEHLENLRRERDDALILIEEERDFAADAIDRLEDQMEQRDKDVNQLLAELRAKEDESQALGKEIEDISASLARVADQSEGGYTAIQNLQQELAEATGECEATQQNLRDALAAKERLEVQAESSQSEIAFLRDEQEADKLKISDLQSAVNRAKTNLQDEKERLREFEEMEAETRKARDEARRLRKSLSTIEEEATVNRETLDEVGNTLRQATNSVEQSLPVLLKHVSRLRRDLESSRADLEQSKGGLDEKHTRLQDHIMLLESSEAERERLATMLEKEQQGRKQDQAELERARQSPTGNSRLGELEKAHAQDQARLEELEHQYSNALGERNQLLFSLWTQLSTLCGDEWLEKFEEVTHQQLPTFDIISTTPSSIDAPLSMALDTISQTLSTFRTRIRSTEKDMHKGFETLSDDLDSRTKRLEHLEAQVAQRSVDGTGSISDTSAALGRLKEENRLLRRELKVLKQGAFALPGLPSPQHELDSAAQEAALIEHERQRMNPSTYKKLAGPTGYRSKRQNSVTGEGVRPGTALQRQHSAPVPEVQDMDPARAPTPASNGNDSPALSQSEQRWVLRLKDLEKKLRAEREGRILDRDGALKRLKERDNEARELKRRLEMEKQRAALSANRQKPLPDLQAADDRR
ncbi:MAG: hypothetical protein Q9162_006421 [Coniocarpon cinnabarinum]